MPRKHCPLTDLFTESTAIMQHVVCIPRMSVVLSEGLGPHFAPLQIYATSAPLSRTWKRDGPQNRMNISEHTLCLAEPEELNPPTGCLVYAVSGNILVLHEGLVRAPEPMSNLLVSLVSSPLRR
jgi:hypothetical protein